VRAKAQRLLSGVSGVERVRGFGGRESGLVAHAPIPSNGWTLAVPIPESEAYEGLPAKLATATIPFVVALVLVAGSIFLVSGRISKPVEELHDAVGRIGAGDLETEINDIRSNDEIADLAHAFNRMARDLHSNVEQLALERSQREELEEENRELVEKMGRSFNLDNEEALRDLIAKGESETLEFKSTLRWNLHTSKPGKEIENASLKTLAGFLNSDGGVLLVGINDDGEPLGLDQDKFPNEDRMLLHFGNLIREHIGLEFAGFISLGISGLAGKPVLVAQCEPSQEPVFFRRDKDEVFYVRVGPSSQALPPSKVLAYVDERRGA